MNEDAHVHSVIRRWRRLPAVVRALLAGAVAGAAGSLPWSLFASANIMYGSAVPWAVIPTALYLYLYWRYVQGEWWPRSTADARRSSSRMNRLPENVWGAALLAGAVGLAAIVLYQRVMSRLVTLPPQTRPDLSQMPLPTVMLLVIMSAVVAGVVEEISFRGYMQKPIEERHGPVLAILATGAMFGFAHFNHPEVTMILLPYYIAVAAVYGALVYFTNSVFPSMVLHAVGNILGSIDLFTRGRSEWQASAAAGRLVWETGPDPSFWLSLGGCIIVGVAAAFAFANLRNVARGSAVPAASLD